MLHAKAHRHGNVILHEQTNNEPIVTWIFEEGTFTPTGKIVGEENYQIVTNYMGTPDTMYDSTGKEVWSYELNSYGAVRKIYGKKDDCPFRYQGQYEDTETGLYYNRFRYYSTDTGLYLSQDPIGLEGGNPTLYGYVRDTNSWVDIFGLDSSGLTNGIPNNPGTVRRFMSKDEYKRFKKNGFKFDPADTRGGISATSTKIRPVNPDAIKRSTGALGADYFVDINTEGLNVELKGKTKEGLPDWKIKDDVSTDRIVNSGRVKCK